MSFHFVVEGWVVSREFEREEFDSAAVCRVVRNFAGVLSRKVETFVEFSDRDHGNRNEGPFLEIGICVPLNGVMQSYCCLFAVEFPCS